MREAADAGVSAYFENLCRAELESSYFLGNEKSKRILEFLGFPPDGAPVDIVSACPE